MTPDGSTPRLDALHSFESETDRFRADVFAGFVAEPKQLSPKYFYDAIGSRLFDAICELPEYYLTRAELSIVENHAASIVESWGSRVRVVEPGAGSGTKTRLLLKALGAKRCLEYVPLDIAHEHLAGAAERIRADIPWLRVVPVAADFTKELPLSPENTVVYFPGSTIGNFEPREAQRLLARFARAAGRTGQVVLGVDLKKDPSILHAAYNDAQGVTAAFNKNLLVRMNRELGADFDVDAFAHHAFYEPVLGRIEMHLVSLRRQTVKVGGRRFSFGDGETLHTECSYKYDLERAEGLARAAGLRLADTWLDDGRRFAVLSLRPE